MPTRKLHPYFGSLFVSLRPSTHPEHFRPVCYRCHKPEQVCICSLIKPVFNKTGITILQHPRERFHPIGTARIAKLGLSNVDLRVVWNGFHADSNLPQKIPPNAGLLFPADNARDLATISEDERPEHLVVLDGTWSTARSLYRSQPCLKALPHYFLNPNAPSQYRIRKEPQEDYRSTIEAIWEALKILEPDNTTLDGLMETFTAMIQVQVDYESRAQRNPRIKRPSNRSSRAIPPILQNKFETVVVAYGEFLEVPAHSGNHQLFYWTASRPATGEIFRAALNPALSEAHQGALTPYFEKMEIPASTFENGLSQTQFKEKWNRFFKPDDTLATWNHVTLRLFEEIIPQNNKPIFLKEAYCNHVKGRCGDLVEVLNKEQLKATPVEALGRSAFRLANAVRVAEFLHTATSPKA